MDDPENPMARDDLKAAVRADLSGLALVDELLVERRAAANEEGAP